MSALPRAKLVAEPVAIRAVSRPPRRLPAFVQHAAVIARQNQQRVLRQLEFVERSQQLADHPVELVDEIAIASAFTGPVEARMRRERVMNVRRGKQQEERRVPMLADPAHRFGGEIRAEFLVLIKRVCGLAA
jgi:hypothetical protein